MPTRSPWSVVPALLLLTAAACPAPSPPPDGEDMASPPGPVLTRPSKSSSIAITEDDAVVAAVSPDDGTLALYSGQSGARTAKVKTGNEPSAVVLHPDGKTAFVANRADATVVRVSGIQGGDPAVSAPVPVGSEPTGLALSPSGRKLFVAEWAESRVSVIDTATMKVVASISDVQSPRALALTNNGDSNDDDETLIVPEFYGEPVPGGEAKDDGRRGVVRLYSARDYAAAGVIRLLPLSADEAGFGVKAAPNQLGAVAVAGRKIYLTSVSASPERPPKFDNNVNPVVYVADLDQKAEVRSATTGTVSLARQVGQSLPAGSARLFLADLRDLDFVPGTRIAYFLSQGADAVQRVAFDDSARLTEFGSTQNKQIDVLGNAQSGLCQGPSGIVIANKSQRAFVNCWISRRLAILDLGGQKVDKTAELAAAPATAEEAAIQRGKRFYFTARARWSSEGWSGCASCHPDGLSDNVTWVFGTGPRQTTSMDGSFSKGPGQRKQRIFNWTGVNDELHDFEGNTRGTSGGKGAVTTAPTQGDCGTLAKELPVGVDDAGTLPAGLASPPVKELQDGAGKPAGVRCVKDWDEVDAFVRTIRPPRGRRGLDPASVQRGAALFAEGKGGCARCHGGAGWTVSSRFYTPSSATNTALSSTVVFTRPGAWPAAYSVHSTFQIAAQPASAEVAGFNAAPLGPPQLACAIRNVATFGIANDTAATDALEIRAAGVGAQGRAQGRGGYNVPSLYGLQLGAPYLHHGQARTLKELFSSDSFRGHTQAGAANFLTGPSADQEREDLINFLLSIDATTAEQAVPAGFDAGCSQ